MSGVLKVSFFVPFETFCVFLFLDLSVDYLKKVAIRNFIIVVINFLVLLLIFQLKN